MGLDVAIALIGVLVVNACILASILHSQAKTLEILRDITNEICEVQSHITS